jgi:hypothetical protein
MCGRREHLVHIAAAAAAADRGAQLPAPVYDKVRETTKTISSK